MLPCAIRRRSACGDMSTSSIWSARADDLVGDGLPLPYAGDRLDDVAQRFQVLDVDGGDDVDAGGEQLLDVLPALGVAGAGDVGVGEFVDQGDCGRRGQHGVDVHLGEDGAAVLECRGGGSLQPSQHHLGVRPAVVLHESDDAVGAPLDAAVRLGEHRVRLADARCRAEVDPSLPRVPTFSVCFSAGPVEGQVEEQHVHGRLAEEAEHEDARKEPDQVLPSSQAVHPLQDE